MAWPNPNLLPNARTYVADRLEDTSSPCSGGRTSFRWFGRAICSSNHKGQPHPLQLSHQRKKSGFLSKARESDSNLPSEMISRRISILALLILFFRSFDLPIVIGAVLRRTKIRFGSAPPTCLKWHFLDRGLEEYRTIKRITHSQKSKRKMTKYLKFRRRIESRRENKQNPRLNSKTRGSHEACVLNSTT